MQANIIKYFFLYLKGMFLLLSIHYLITTFFSNLNFLINFLLSSNISLGLIFITSFLKFEPVSIFFLFLVILKWTFIAMLVSCILLLLFLYFSIILNFSIFIYPLFCDILTSFFIQTYGSQERIINKIINFFEEEVNLEFDEYSENDYDYLPDDEREALLKYEKEHDGLVHEIVRYNLLEFVLTTPIPKFKLYFLIFFALILNIFFYIVFVSTYFSSGDLLIVFILYYLFFVILYYKFPFFFAQFCVIEFILIIFFCSLYIIFM